MDKSENHQYTNQLAQETSPYLLQHAHNPVQWHPWGEAALTQARTHNRPILLSIGYSACHWCHVMERESFENPEIAALMNQHFVCIKVDREERPDLDTIYMAATTALNNGRGGWPMTVFLTPALEPFFAGTYFPPQDVAGMSGFPRILTRLADLWQSEPDALLAHAAELSEAVRAHVTRLAPGSPSPENLSEAVDDLSDTFDPHDGGFGGAPKFPHAQSIELLLVQHARKKDANARHMAQVTLDHMARGGMYDHIGGGFARYSTDAAWLVPHFEKMLYDNASLTTAYLYAWQVTGESLYAQVARETLDYVLRDMTAPEGGFYASTDADSEGEEGKYYVWTPAEVQAVLGSEEARRICAYYDITDAGNWEGKSIPHVTQSVADVAQQLGIAADALTTSLSHGRAKLYEARCQRVAPGLDDKVLTAWNGLMLTAFSEASRILGEPRYLHAACRNADFILQSMRQPDGTLWRTYRHGRAHLNAYLEDYAYFCAGLLALYEAGAAPTYLEACIALANQARRLFASDDGAFYDTASTHETLLARSRSGHDGATPSPNAVFAHVLARLSHHTDDASLRRDAEAALLAFGASMARAPGSYCQALMAWDFLTQGPVELSFIGLPLHDDPLWRASNTPYLPRRILAHGSASHPLLVGKASASGQSTLYICRNRTCGLPITLPSDALASLSVSS